MNIDGLAQRTGLHQWSECDRTRGSTVEMHGSIYDLVCPCCRRIEAIEEAHLKLMRSCRAPKCPTCPSSSMRPKVMMYDDAEGDCITSRSVMDLMGTDAEVVTLK